MQYLTDKQRMEEVCCSLREATMGFFQRIMATLALYIPLCVCVYVFTFKIQNISFFLPFIPSPYLWSYQLPLI